MKKKHENLSTGFNEVTRRAALFAERATVATLQVSPYTCTQIRDGVKTERKHTADDVQTAFLGYLKEQGVKHEVIARNGEDGTLVFAVAKEKDLEAANIRGVVNAYFSDGREVALSFQAYYHEDAGIGSGVKNALLKPFDKTRREVSRAVKNLR